MKATLGMKCIDPMIFTETMFSWGPDFVASVEFLPSMFGYGECPRELERELEWQNRTPNIFASMIVVQTLGQYSLVKSVSIFALSRADGYVREATPEEARLDFSKFGEQVMGDKHEDVSDGQATVTFMGKEFLYTGPSRLERLIHTLGVLPGNNPGKEALQEIIVEIGKTLEGVKTEHIHVENGYALIIADKGRISVGNFKNLDQLNLEKLQFVGQLEMRSGKLLFLPEGDKKKSIDFSQCIYRNYRD